jgi:hypothetical protein
MPELHDIRSTSIGPTNIGSQRVARALTAVRLLDDGTLTELRVAIADYVRVQRAVGATPEALLAQIKQLVAQSIPIDGTFELRQTVTARVVEWAIAAYYGTSQQGDPTAQRLARELQD